MSKRVADALFPDIRMTYQEAEALYPPRNLPEGAVCTRFAPSPTLHAYRRAVYRPAEQQLYQEPGRGVFPPH